MLRREYLKLTLQTEQAYMTVKQKNPTPKIY